MLRSILGIVCWYAWNSEDSGLALRYYTFSANEISFFNKLNLLKFRIKEWELVRMVFCLMNESCYECEEKCHYFGMSYNCDTDILFRRQEACESTLSFKAVFCPFFGAQDRLVAICIWLSLLYNLLSLRAGISLRWEMSLLRISMTCKHQCSSLTSDACHLLSADLEGCWNTFTVWLCHRASRGGN